MSPGGAHDQSRRRVVTGALPLLAAWLLGGCTRPKPVTAGAAADTVVPLDKPDEFWRAKVSPPAYAVLFDEDTDVGASANVLSFSRFQNADGFATVLT